MFILLAQSVNGVSAPLSLALGERSIAVVYRQIMQISLEVFAVIVLVIGVYGLVTFLRTRKQLPVSGSVPPQTNTSRRVLWVSRIIRWVAVGVAYIAGFLAQDNIPPLSATALRNTRDLEITIGFFLFVTAVLIYGVGMYIRQRFYTLGLQQVQASSQNGQATLVRKQYVFHLFLSGCLQLVNLLVIYSVLNLVTRY